MPHTLIQSIQNFAARVITNTKRYSPITPILYTLHWLPVKMRMKYKILVIVFKCLHNMAPKYLQDLIITSHSTYALRNKNAPWLTG